MLFKFNVTTFADKVNDLVVKLFCIYFLCNKVCNTSLSCVVGCYCINRSDNNQRRRGGLSSSSDHTY